MEYTTGNLLDADTEALVNTVNTVGVMGKGIALQFKQAFPENFKRYAAACKAGELEPGKLLFTTEHTVQGDRIIINFPTKTEYYRKSKYEYIEAGLATLATELPARGISSVAVPPLGCGHGGLNWEKVRRMIEDHLGPLPMRVVVFEPSEAVKAVLRRELAKESHLTPARAMLLSGLFYYEEMGAEASLFVANKVGFFLQGLGEPLRLKFVAHHYGPYAPQVAHVLYDLNGKYIKGMEQKDARPFEPLYLSYAHRAEVDAFVERELSPLQRQRLERLRGLLADFRSAFALEMLSSVSLILQQHPGAGLPAVLDHLRQWSSRKENMAAREDLVTAAYEHLLAYGNSLEIV
ncbi:MAG: macro domain-containing protein [Flavobacteriales bacterium]|nr:macro domain-containing protein [Flavobacteriales bacterium]MCB9193530.1 macro domain-containing protein [Flavobacteriales bacterium]